jgi:catechol 2,3-dioxygenase-like lactoylglutathione lyase family enzyme
MTTQVEQNPPHPFLSATVAQLFVSDIKASCDFFTTKLGFVVRFTYGDPPFYGAVKRDNARLAAHMRVSFHRRYPPARALVIGHDRGQYRGADQTTVPRLPDRRGEVPLDPQEGAVGRQEFHRRGPGR